jgi:hypothetical protein
LATKRVGIESRDRGHIGLARVGADRATVAVHVDPPLRARSAIAITAWIASASPVVGRHSHARDNLARDPMEIRRRYVVDLAALRK